MRIATIPNAFIRIAIDVFMFFQASFQANGLPNINWFTQVYVLVRRININTRDFLKFCVFWVYRELIFTTRYPDHLHIAIKITPLCYQCFLSNTI